MGTVRLRSSNGHKRQSNNHPKSQELTHHHAMRPGGWPETSRKMSISCHRILKELLDHKM